MATGKYIVIEGHDGTGKSTQVGLLRSKLATKGIESIEFHELEGSPIADEIRHIIKRADLPRGGMTNVLLFSAARHDIWHTKALPALESGVWVVASRNYYSTLAYQGYGEGLDLDIIGATTRLATDDTYMQPDYAVILSLEDEAKRVQRIEARGPLTTPDTFESRSSDFQTRVHDGYVALAESHRIPVVDANGTPEEVAARIWTSLELG